MKKPFLITVAILLLAGGISVWKGCRPGPSHDAEDKHLDSAAVKLTHQQDSLVTVIIRLRKDSAGLQQRFDSTRRYDSVVREDLMARAQVVRNTLTGGDLAASRRDTAAILINWDSLRAEVKAGLPIVILHDSLSQEQISTCLEQGRVKDSIVESWHTLFVLTDTAYRQSRTAYKGLLKDYDHQQFQLKIWKPVAIGGAAYIALSIIIHSLKK